jgi:hypothetical protein
MGRRVGPPGAVRDSRSRACLCESGHIGISGGRATRKFTFGSRGRLGSANNHVQLWEATGRQPYEVALLARVAQAVFCETF